jgi:polyisoprenoid-binding protein YceI
MESLKSFVIMIAIALAGEMLICSFEQLSQATALMGDTSRSSCIAVKLGGPVSKNTPSSTVPATQRYRLEASESKFIAHALRGGLLWFKGHEHLVAAHQFTGEAEITPDSITPASLRLNVKTESMTETSSVFTEQQKQIINRELREIVLLPAKYPEIVFKSTDVTGKLRDNGEYDLKIGGDLTLLGLTRHIVIPAEVTLIGNDLRAHGEFSISRSDFKVKATSAMHGLIRVRDKIKFTFDIVGHKY